MPHSRAHIRLNNQTEAMNFVQILSEHKDEFSIEDFNGSHRVNAKSILGVMYASMDFNDEMFLVNDSNGEIPNSIDVFRVVAA